MQTPTNVTKLRSFLGLRNVYRRFVSNFALIAAPLTHNLRSDNCHTVPDMNEAEMNSFRHLKEALVKPLLLSLPLSDLTNVLDTDACEKQLDAVLMQHSEYKSLRPTIYYPRTLMTAKRNNDRAKRECLVIVWAILLLHPYLYVTHFEIRTNHYSLWWIFHMDTSSGRLSRWKSWLQEFDFEVVYGPEI